MYKEYDSDDFDMENVAGVDNPMDTDDDYDEAAKPEDYKFPRKEDIKPYSVKTRIKVRDKKTGQIVYKVIGQSSSKPRRLSKPFSYKKS